MKMIDEKETQKTNKQKKEPGERKLWRKGER